MFQNSQSEGRTFRFGRSFLLVTAISSGILMAVLSGIAKTPAKPALDEFTDNTGRALAQLTPMALGRRYMDIVESRLNPCLNVPYGDAMRQCYAAHPGNPSNADTLTSLFAGFFSLLRQIFAESWTQSAIDIFQLIAGFILAITLISLPKRTDFVMHPLFGFFFFAFWIGCASVFSYLTVLILHIGAGTLNEMLPSQTGLSVAGGAWGGLVITWASHTIEDALSHGTGHIVEHTLKSIFRFGK